MEVFYFKYLQRYTFHTDSVSVGFTSKIFVISLFKYQLYIQNRARCCGVIIIKVKVSRVRKGLRLAEKISEEWDR